MCIKALVIDYGGVLVLTAHQLGRRKWEEQLGLEESSLFGALFSLEVADQAILGEISEAEAWRQAGAILGVPPDAIQEFRRDFWAGDQLNTELVEHIKERRRRYGLKVAILTNAWSDARSICTDRFGLGCIADEIIVSAEEGIAKPHPRIYQAAAERLGVRLSEAIFVDDMMRNVQGAISVGMRAVLFASNSQAIAELDKYLALR